MFASNPRAFKGIAFWFLGSAMANVVIAGTFLVGDHGERNRVSWMAVIDFYRKHKE